MVRLALVSTIRQGLMSDDDDTGTMSGSERGDIAG